MSEPTGGSPPEVPKVVVSEDRDMQSVLMLDESTVDPTMYYRFVPDLPMRIARRKMQGYVPVTKESGVKTLVDVDDSADGTIRVGDCILMACPLDRVKARTKGYSAKAVARLSAPAKKVKKAAKIAGFTATENTKEE